ncbi:MAG: DUF2066 domain-containing protein [Alphaproteobacteria bacterium]|nr:DUF2066 domain-containing protein [Alphaproteobacteria bacterium]NCQ87408.1 DUF2066 domain-containing protein [Alphaproteobacteria bacterium]NCT06279.1 DUF2066 domain-containing protein [Alphaproteobacteria bacterium]
MTISLTAFSYRHLQRLRTVFYAALMVMCFADQAASASALYTVENVEVDVTADNAVQARKKAFVEAQVKAYQMLSERLLAEDPQAKIEELDADAISYLVQDFEVTKEQLTAKRYKGNYTIRFRSDAFKKKAVAQGRSYTDLPRGAILVLPYYQSAGNTILWSPMNPFMAAWARAPKSGDPMSSIVVPIGDIDDVAAVNEYSPLSYDPSRFEKMRSRYGAKDAMIVLVAPEMSPDGRETLKLSLYNAAPNGPEFSGQFTVEGEMGEATQSLYDRAVTQTKQQFKSEWKNETAITTNTLGTINAVMPFGTMRDWIESKRTLESVSGINAIRVTKLSPRQASMDIDFVGELARLNRALQRSGIIMTSSEGQYGKVYTLRRQAFPPVHTNGSTQRNNNPYGNTVYPPQAPVSVYQ